MHAKFVPKILSGNEILRTGNNPKLDLVNVDVYTKFGLILCICFQDIELKQILTSIKGCKVLSKFYDTNCLGGV